MERPSGSWKGRRPHSMHGLGARDTLRMEAAMPLYGHEMNEEISPLEAGLTFAVKLAKEDFIGKRHWKRQESPSGSASALK
ncbi:MAG: hypothetical protein ACLS70_08560 [[Clostridium] symbiosum]